ncbi:MAG TPA: 50S ribosomal protein L25 [Bryobacteraceae bacterium]|nr:50S ribosomal protein L25 [Bryobacteraceae bacterium]
MRKEITVAAQPRDTRGKNAARRTRRAGSIPAVVYGAFKDPVAIAVSPKDIHQIVHSSSGYNTIFNLDIAGGETTPVMVIDHQNDPIRGTLLHADLKRIDLSKRLRVSIPVTTQGEPKGVKTQGGLLEVVTRAAEIECLPDEIPEHFVVDVTELLIGQSRRFSDLPMSGSMKLVSSPDTVVAHVVALRAEEVKPAAEAAPTAEAAAPAAAEPEVIKKGKKEEAAEEAKPKKK